MRCLAWETLACSLLLGCVKAQSTSSGVNVANVPDCAKVCLSNSTQYATDCTQIDVKCLCNSPSYVSALSCCLATNCSPEDQQIAIQFNIQECAAVNSTAPNFVGCSPFSLTTGGQNKPTLVASSVGEYAAAATTISGGLATLPARYTNTKINTIVYGGAPLLTEQCSIPMFAQVTDLTGNVVQFPQVGCALDRGNCCPFEPNLYAGLNKCPQDYATTAGACCPSGYSVYYTAIGAETPCFSKPTKTLVPSTTITGANVTLMTDAVFSRKYELVQGPRQGLAVGAIAGIAVAAAILVALPFIIYWILKRRRSKAEKAAQRDSTTFPPNEPVLSPQHEMSEAPATPAAEPRSELASPDTGAYTPAAFKGMPFVINPPSSPPAYGVQASPVAPPIPQEMPGSTYMHEHHPAYSESRPDVTTQSPPRTPPRSPETFSTRSPVLSPSSPLTGRTGSPSNIGTITPIVSPMPMGSSPRFREGAM